MSHERLELLRQVFPDLPPPLLAELAQKVRERTYPLGTILCQEGALEDTFYIIVSGRVVVSKVMDGETSRILTYQGPGEFFGELALIQDTQRAATVVTLEETTVFELSKQDFLSLLENSPAMVITIMNAVAARLRAADQRSIADLRRKTQELNQAYRELEAETEHRSRFLTMVAHELRTPLTTVKGYLNLMEAGQLPAEMTSNVIETVSDNVDAIVRLINNILFLQEIELIEPHFRPVAVSEIVQQAVDEISGQAHQAGLSLRLDISPDLPTIMGDPASLKQAIMALLENAIKFSPNGGEIQINVYPRQSTLEIAVCDPGVGIPQADLDHLFDRIRHRDASEIHLRGGVGLGLPIAKAVVEQHKGSIRVASQEGYGSTFTISLPISSE